MIRGQKSVERQGLTIVEVIVAMALLAIVGASLVAILPQLSRNTRVATEDTTLSNVVYGIFDRIGSDWTNVSGWSSESVTFDTVNVPIATFVANETDNACEVVTQPTQGGVLRRVTITCLDAGPGLVLRAEYGTPE